MSVKVKSAEEFSRALKKCYEDYTDEVVKILENNIEDVVNQGQKRLKTMAPKKTGAYKKSISRRKTKDLHYTLYSRSPHSRLTHLLEKPHNIVDRNKKHHGKSRAFEHWGPVEEWINKEIVDRTERKLK